METSTPFRFLGLPLEIRREIYRYLLVPTKHLDEYLDHYTDSYYDHASFSVGQTMRESNQDNKRCTSILFVSRQVYEESLNVFYAEHIFNLDLTSMSTSRLVLADIAPIRRLVLVVKTRRRPSMLKWGMLKGRLKPHMLENLRYLCLVLQEPGTTASSRREILAWKKLLRPMMGYIGKNLPNDVLVEVDDDEEEVTGEIIKRSLSVGHQKVQTRIGDAVFARKEFAYGFSHPAVQIDLDLLAQYQMHQTGCLQLPLPDEEDSDL